MRAMRRLFAALAIVLSAGLAMAFDKGPPVGTQIPSQLDALDSGGVEQSFAKLKGEKGLVLVFIRATAWCPYCQKQVIELEAIRKDIEARGYRVLTATDGEDALRVVAAHASNIDLLLTDVVMPHMSGPALATGRCAPAGSCTSPHGRGWSRSWRR